MKLTLKELRKIINESKVNETIDEQLVDTVGMGYARATVKLREMLNEIGCKGVAKILVDAFGANQVVDALENIR